MVKILAIDVGLGTQDILFFDSSKNIENCIKMILPSPTMLLAKKIKRTNKDLVLTGETMGGGPILRAIKEHIRKGYSVFMDRKAASSIRDDLAQVKEMGVKIVEDFKARKENAAHLETKDIDLEKLGKILSMYGVNLDGIDVIAVAVQDHGVAPKGMSDRKFRFEKIESILGHGAGLEAFAFTAEEVPGYLSRMKAVVRTIRKDLPEVDLILMDTSFAAVYGATMDPEVRDKNPIISVNVGNGHTTASIISEDKIAGIFEHHTRLLSRKKLEEYIIKLADGELTNSEIFDDGGHGACTIDAPGFKNIKKIVATGPNRNLLKDSILQIHFAAPGGDVMLTGPIGLIEASRMKLNI